MQEIDSVLIFDVETNGLGNGSGYVLWPLLFSHINAYYLGQGSVNQRSLMISVCKSDVGYDVYLQGI